MTTATQVRTADDVDIGFVADIRWPGGSSTALLHEIRAFRSAGYSCALAPVAAKPLARSRPPHPALFAELARLDVPVLPASARCAARLVMVHHPAVCEAATLRRLPFQGRRVALVAHHPAVERDGRRPYDYARAADVLEGMFGCRPIILPVGPWVRRTLEDDAPGLQLWDHDWPNLLSLEEWPERDTRDIRARQAHLTLGRHSRPDVLKFPDRDTADLVYPARPDLRVRMLGVDDAIRAHFDPWPGHWQGLPFRPGAAPDFLRSLDIYAYYHATRWLEAFGYAVLEALAAGLPTLLPPYLADTFGEGPIYAEPRDAPEIYDRLIGDPDARAEAGKAARAAAARFDVTAAAGRIGALVGPPASPHRRPPPPERPDTVLAVTSNGVGAGHVMRQIAIARAAPLDQRTVFFTLSKAALFARRAGFLTETRPHHRHYRMHADAWNDWFRAQLAEALRFYAPRAVIFDGNMPYRGVLQALEAAPDIGRIWMRRGLWRQPSPEAAKRSHAFDLILQPGELADASDPGHAARGSAPFVTLPPVLPCARELAFSRPTARRLLGLPERGDIVLMSLGAGANFDMTKARAAVLASFPEAIIVEPLNPVAPPPPPPAHDRHLRCEIFPIARYMAAFDAGVLAAGYNLFHEAISAGLPTLFVPNTAAEMDLQESRTDYAARTGLALGARADDPYGLAAGLHALRMPDTRARLRAACATCAVAADGAEVAARHITLAVRRHRLAA